jgi:hypothetical protein
MLARSRESLGIVDLGKRMLTFLESQNKDRLQIAEIQTCHGVLRWLRSPGRFPQGVRERKSWVKRRSLVADWGPFLPRYCKFPQLHGRLHDQASIIEGAKSFLDTQGVIGRCDLIAGNFLDSVPKDFEVKSILHD